MKTVSVTWTATLAAAAVSAHFAVAAAQGAPGAPQGTRFRSSVSVVRLHVTVSNAAGQPFTGLGQQDFVILEDGRPRPVELFHDGSTPLALTLLLDMSSSLRHLYDDVQESAIAFLRQLPPDDVTSIVGFDDRVRVLQGFTSDTVSLETAVRKTRADGGTKLYNALYIALSELSRLRPEVTGGTPRRRVVVVVSDGRDTTSLVSLKDVLDAAIRAGVAIYPISIAPPKGAGWRDPKDDAAALVLRRLAHETGGRAFVDVPKGLLAEAYREIRTELAHQYTIGYVSKSRRGGGFRRLAVQVLRPGAHARTRSGYFAGPG